MYILSNWERKKGHKVIRRKNPKRPLCRKGRGEQIASCHPYVPISLPFSSHALYILWQFFHYSSYTHTHIYIKKRDKKDINSSSNNNNFIYQNRIWRCSNLNWHRPPPSRRPQWKPHSPLSDFNHPLDRKNGCPLKALCPHHPPPPPTCALSLSLFRHKNSHMPLSQSMLSQLVPILITALAVMPQCNVM